MAKKNRSISKKTISTPVDESENRLPQNIISIGERVEEDKKIYISQPAYKMIHRFTQGKTTNESGGMLIGSIIEEFGKTNIVICGFVEAKYCEATPTTLKFTHETWEYCHKEIEKKYPGKKIVGWIHTHPDFGIFLSEYDKFIQENFFKEEYEVAYVIDPIQGIEGFYFWINGKIERCKGFYVFDKTGTKIGISVTDEENPRIVKQQTGSLLSRIVIAALIVAVLALTVSVVNLNGKIEVLQSQQETIVASANQSLSYLQQQILSLQARVDALTASEDTETTESGDNGEQNNPSSQTDTNATESDPVGTEPDEVTTP
jgi:proteasome lid subunit RPN8/RPN11